MSGGPPLGRLRFEEEDYLQTPVLRFGFGVRGGLRFRAG